MKFLSVICLLTLCLNLSATAADLPKAAPEATGVSSQAILDFVDAVEEKVDALHSFVLMRHGKIIAEGWWAPYEAEAPHMLYSLSKSFASTAIGFAVDEKRISLDDQVVSFFPDQVPEDPSQNLLDMRIRDLLCMGSGHHNDTLGPMKDRNEDDWIKVFLTQPVQHKPGTYFRYNTGATYMLSAIIQKVTGEKLVDYLKPRLFVPLGIKDFNWETSPQGINSGGYGLKVNTHAIAKLGQMYLQKGQWNGKPLLSEAWVAEATTSHISNGDNPKSDWNQGYGFQFWRCRHNAYRGDGAFGQYCVVMPDQDAVLAITSGLGNMQQVLDLAWEHLLPAMQPDTLPPAPELQKRLTEKTAALQLKTVSGQAANPGELDVFGKVYHFDDNDKGLQTLSLQQDKAGVVITIRNAHGEQRFSCGMDGWKAGTLNFEKELYRKLGATNGRQPIGVSCAWTAADRYVADVYFTETPYRMSMTLQFKDEQLFLNLTHNVSFGKKKWQLTGRLQPPTKESR